MQIDEFKSIVSTFSDPGTELLYEKQRLVFSINGNVIDAAISAKSGDIYVSENNSAAISASQWIVNRLANLPLLAARLTEQIPIERNFISPSANLLPTLDKQPDGQAYEVSDARHTLLESLESKSPLETTVLYITSDAGEGKTWLINAAARTQAKNFSDGKSDWLLVPIVLGGRHFLRFDDITVGALQNKYRFPFLYYNSFLALVRMGVIVPAFDGFEEMFVENSSGEALSAMGILVDALKSAGCFVVAARKAYFEFENLKSQEKLYDSISSQSVGFSKLELRRWGREQFLKYCIARGVVNPDQTYSSVKDRLGENHSLLTRPVLVRRLIDIANSSDSLESFLEQIRISGADFFSVFVRGIIDREAKEKWIDRSGGEVATSLLSTEEHCELLAMIAVNMWESRVSFLKLDHLDVVADYFCELKRKPSLQAHQIRERIRGHALLVSSRDAPSAVEFDHDEFRQFFLGEGLADILRPSNGSAKSELLSVVRRSILPDHARLSFIRAIDRNSAIERKQVAALVASVGELDGQASYTQENCGHLVIRLLNGIDDADLKIEGLTFGVDALFDCSLTDISFDHCYFSLGRYEATTLKNCTFTQCKFGQMQLYQNSIFSNVTLNECTVDSLKFSESGHEIWEPFAIKANLEKLGFSFGDQVSINSFDESSGFEIDPEVLHLQKLLRYFTRSTHISESIIKIRLGDKGQGFIDNELPTLQAAKVIVEIENRGGSTQRRFKLGLPLHFINNCLSSAEGRFEVFLARCRQHFQGDI